MVVALTSEVPGSVLLKAVTAFLHESLAAPCTGRAAKERRQSQAVWKTQAYEFPSTGVDTTETTSYGPTAQVLCIPRDWT